MAQNQFLCAGNHQSLETVAQIKETMPTEDELFLLAEIFKVFGDSTRIKIITALQDRELCVCELSELLNTSQSAVSHQLRLLRTNRLVKNRRDGKQIYYSLDDGHVATILAQGLEHVRHKHQRT